jgi:hypothetical protein
MRKTKTQKMFKNQEKSYQISPEKKNILKTCQTKKQKVSKNFSKNKRKFLGIHSRFSFADYDN